MVMAVIVRTLQVRGVHMSVAPVFYALIYLSLAFLIAGAMAVMFQRLHFAYRVIWQALGIALMAVPLFLR